MATYKVLQDIEADDKLLGPLSLKQFIYAVVVVVSGFIAYKLAYVSPFLIIPFVPVIVFFGLLAAPLGRDQPNEIWLLARIRYFLKPRIRIWNQNGFNQLVTITIPKKIERSLTKNYTQGEVRSRLQALANTIDTRGWAIKNVNVNLYSQPSYLLNQGDSDRLIDPETIPTEVPNVEVTAQDDIYETNNIKAQHINEILSSQEQQQAQYYKKLAVEGKSNPNTPEANPDYWFMNEVAGQRSAKVPAGYSQFQDDPVVLPGDDSSYAMASSPDDPELLRELEAHKQTSQNRNGHMHVVERLSDKKALPQLSPQTAVTSHPVNAKIESLARDNNRSVASLAHEANEDAKKDGPPEEVIISLH